MLLRAEAPPFVPSKVPSSHEGTRNHLGDKLIQDLADRIIHGPRQATLGLDSCMHMPVSGLFCPCCVAMRPCPFHKPSNEGMWTVPPQSAKRVRILSRSATVELDDHSFQHRGPLPLASTPILQVPWDKPAAWCDETERGMSVAKMWLEKGAMELDDASTDICVSEIHGIESEDSDDALVADRFECQNAPAGCHPKAALNQLPYKSTVWNLRAR